MSITTALRALFSKSFGEADPGEAANALREGALLVDVREQDEWDDGHIPGAIHIPLGQLRERLDEIPVDVEVITVCRSGMRSARAAGQVAKGGRTVSNLTGGTNAWDAAGLPVTRPGTSDRLR
jgi:rhodanese-related sulfurtransferase